MVKLIVVPEGLPGNVMGNVVPHRLLKLLWVAGIVLGVVVHQADHGVARVPHHKQVLAHQPHGIRLFLPGPGAHMHHAPATCQVMSSRIHPYVAPLLHRRPHPLSNAFPELPVLALHHTGLPGWRIVLRIIERADLRLRRLLETVLTASLSCWEVMLRLCAKPQNFSLPFVIARKRRHNPPPDLDVVAVLVDPALTCVLNQLLGEHLSPRRSHLWQTLQEHGGVSAVGQPSILVTLDAFDAERDHGAHPFAGQVEFHVFACAGLVLLVGVVHASKQNVGGNDHHRAAHFFSPRPHRVMLQEIEAIQHLPKDVLAFPRTVAPQEDAEGRLAALVLAFLLPRGHHYQCALLGSTG
mmetsp:Transcript_10970/g.30990  ORF Transcript_10970/g.30990 Transcript_10970/m.30990 type:complete len:353 (+) Transcript_10970:806-1864(+)